MSTRLSITLTDSQSAALERIAAETGATKQSMIGLAVSAWIAQQERQQSRRGWYGYAVTDEKDPLSGETMRASVGYDGPFATRAEAMAHAERVAQSNREDGLQAEPRAEWED